MRYPPPAVIGVTVKSGWACVVLVAGSAARPRLIDSRRIELSDPAIPESRQPYHAGFGTARSAGAERTRLVAGVRRFGRRSVTEVIRHYRSLGHRVTGAGVIVGSMIDPKAIANDHIRIHAMEGQLFREVVRDAVARMRLSCWICRERDLIAHATSTLKRSEAVLRRTADALGDDVDGPWRAEHKAAALAAWLVLAQRTPAHEKA
jgi:hypothetical protein